MTETASHSDTAVESQSQLQVAGRRMTDVTAIVGSAVWLTLVSAARSRMLDLSTVELFVLLALFVFVPLGLGLAATPRRSGEHILPYRVAIIGQFPTALAAAGALALPVGSVESILLALPWLGVTGAVATFGLWRLQSRGLTPLPELAIDAALLYVPVGAVALLLHQAGISFHFQPIIILLTAVHYHYAGFVLPLVAGLAGRIIADDKGRFGAGITGRAAAAITLVIIVNLALIAVGITFSPLVEVVAVTFFTVAVAGFSILVLRHVVPAVPRLPGTLLAIASLAIFATMALALAYGYSAYSPNTQLITIGGMIRWHGTLNAFGFAVPALLAFRLLDD